MYKVIYQISKYPFPKDLIISLVFTAGFAFFFLERIFTFKTLINSSRVSIFSLIFSFLKNFIIIILLGLAVLVGCVGIDAAISDGGSQDRYFSKKFYAGEYKVVEGYVENY